MCHTDGQRGDLLVIAFCYLAGRPERATAQPPSRAGRATAGAVFVVVLRGDGGMGVCSGAQPVLWFFVGATW
ncbi:hypothetical protein [Streptomyces hypolithicus]